MKKLSVSIFVFLMTLSTVNATTLNYPIKKSTIEFSAYDTSVSSFCKLIQMGDYDAVKALIEAGENVNKKSNGLTPLMFAARHNKAEIAKLLIESGANLKIKSDKGRMTALSMAKRSKAMDAVKVIKEAL